MLGLPPSVFFDILPMSKDRGVCQTLDLYTQIKIVRYLYKSISPLYFNANEFEFLLRDGIQTEQLLKKQKEESML